MSTTSRLCDENVKYVNVVVCLQRYFGYELYIAASTLQLLHSIVHSAALRGQTRVTDLPQSLLANLSRDVQPRAGTERLLMAATL